MSATDVTAYAMGKNAREAYRTAVDAATWEHGNDGYNGTISTCELKGTFGGASALLSFIDRDLGQLDRLGRNAEWASEREQAASEAKRIRAVRKKAARERISTSQMADLMLEAGFVEKWTCVSIELSKTEARKWKASEGLKGKRGNVYCFVGVASC